VFLFFSSGACMFDPGEAQSILDDFRQRHRRSLADPAVFGVGLAFLDEDVTAAPAIKVYVAKHGPRTLRDIGLPDAFSVMTRSGPLKIMVMIAPISESPGR
jgi:hypothetical protein